MSEAKRSTPVFNSSEIQVCDSPSNGAEQLFSQTPGIVVDTFYMLLTVLTNKPKNQKKKKLKLN